MSRFERRDFLKLAGASVGALAASPLLQAPGMLQRGATGPNVLVVVFDAFSARNMSLYGYGRDTTPNITRLADRAIVYHNHYAASNWTSPSTASLLTGVLPWTHRVLDINEPITRDFEAKNIFSQFRGYHRTAYSHNPLVYPFLLQFLSELEELVPIEQLLLTYDAMVQRLFLEDLDTASVAWRRIIKKRFNDQQAYSLYLAELYRAGKANMMEGFAQAFPAGLPFVRDDNYFTLEQAIDHLARRLPETPRPWLAYYHLIPPHDPYKPPREFLGRFLDDAFRPPRKRRDLFRTQRKMTYEVLQEARRPYDEYILYVDREFSRLYRALEDSGTLDDTWLVLTSDHGEMFERAIIGHNTPLLYEPLVRIPLLLFEPRRRQRLDVRSNTSTLDLLPTLAAIAGHASPDWSEGSIMPPFQGGQKLDERSIFSVFARGNTLPGALDSAGVMLVRGNHKLTYYFGYDELAGKERVELYDVASDPEELDELSESYADLAENLLAELRTKLRAATAGST